MQVGGRGGGKRDYCVSPDSSTAQRVYCTKRPHQKQKATTHLSSFTSLKKDATCMFSSTPASLYVMARSWLVATRYALLNPVSWAMGSTIVNEAAKMMKRGNFSHFGRSQ